MSHYKRSRVFCCSVKNSTPCLPFPFLFSLFLLYMQLPCLVIVLLSVQLTTFIFSCCNYLFFPLFAFNFYFLLLYSTSSFFTTFLPFLISICFLSAYFLYFCLSLCFIFSPFFLWCVPFILLSTVHSKHSK